MTTCYIDETEQNKEWRLIRTTDYGWDLRGQRSGSPALVGFSVVEFRKMAESLLVVVAVIFTLWQKKQINSHKNSIDMFVIDAVLMNAIDLRMGLLWSYIWFVLFLPYLMIDLTHTVVSDRKVIIIYHQ